MIIHYRKYYKSVVLTLLISILLYLPYRIFSVIKIKSSIMKEIEILPDFEFTTLQGTRFGVDNIIKGSPVVIFFFNSECYYCINEVESIIGNINSLKNTNILLVSEQPLNKLAELYDEYKLYKYPQVKLLHSSYRNFISIFGNTVVPSTYIYNERISLLKLFKGEAGIESILKVINNP